MAIARSPAAKRWWACLLLAAFTAVATIGSIPVSRAWGLPATVVALVVAGFGLAVTVALLVGSFHGRPVLSQLLASVLWVMVVVAVVGLVTSRISTDAVQKFTVMIGAAAIGTSFTWPLIEVWANRRATSRQIIDCAIRPSPPVEARKDRWQHGSLTLRSGTFHFTPGGPGGLRFPRGDRRPFPIHVMSEAAGHPSWRQAMSINPGLTIVEVEGDGSTHQIAARDSDIKRIRGWLTARQPPTGGSHS